MTAVIRYKTPYFINNRDPSFFVFVLSNNVTLHCVLGFPILLASSGFIYLVKGEFVCSKINRNFPLTLDPPGKGLRKDIVFDNSTPIIPQGMSTNVKPNPSLLQYTSAKGRALHHSLPSYSEDIIIHVFISRECVKGICTSLTFYTVG